MDVKQCECDALVLLRRMAMTYSLTVDDFQAATTKAAADDVVVFMKHIRQQLGKPEYQDEEALRPMKPRLELIEGRIREAEKEQRWMGVLDVIKDTLHKNPEFRQMFLCGIPGVNTPLADQVREVIHVMGEEIDDVGPMLKKLLKQQDCPGAKFMD